MSRTDHFWVACSQSAPAPAQAQPIVGGATDPDYWYTLLLYNPNVGSLCSGTLISERTVLTAAHCQRMTEAYFVLNTTGSTLTHLRAVEQDVGHPE